MRGADLWLYHRTDNQRILFIAKTPRGKEFILDESAMSVPKKIAGRVLAAARQLGLRVDFRGFLDP